MEILEIDPYSGLVVGMNGYENPYTVRVSSLQYKLLAMLNITIHIDFEIISSRNHPRYQLRFRNKSLGPLENYLLSISPPVTSFRPLSIPIYQRTLHVPSTLHFFFSYSSAPTLSYGGCLCRRHSTSTIMLRAWSRTSMLQLWSTFLDMTTSLKRGEVGVTFI